MNFAGLNVMRSADLKTITALGKITYDNWDECPTEKAHFLVICKFLDHVPHESDFHIENYQWVECSGNTFNVSTTVKSDSIFGCELIYNEDRKQYDMKYKSVPTLSKDYIVERDTDLSKYHVTGNLAYNWPDCESEKQNYELYCGFFDDIATIDQIKIGEYKRDITCEKNPLEFSSKGESDHYLTCLMYHTTDNQIADKISSGTPSLNIENWSLKLGKDLTKYELRGDNRLEWKTCNMNNEVMDFRITCGFYKNVPTADDFRNSWEMDMELECGGWPWQVMWTKDNSYRYWGCMTYGRNDKAVADLKYVEAAEIVMPNKDSITESDGKYVVKDKMSLNWSKCEGEKDQYGYVCNWFNSIPTYADMANKKSEMKEIVCGENEIDVSSDNLSQGYLGCGILRKSTNDVISVNYIAKKAIDVQEIAMYTNDGKIYAKGSVNLNWAECENEKSDYQLIINFFDHYPTVDETWDSKKIEISCGKTEIKNEFTSKMENVYFAVRLEKTDGKVLYDMEAVKLPSFDLSGLDFSFTNQYYDHRIISGFIPIDFPNCERYHNQYSMICDFSSSVPTYESLINGFNNKIVCDSWELRGLTSQSTEDNIFGCMMIENESKKVIQLSYAELGGLDMKEVKMSKADNNKVTVNGVLKYKLGNDAKAEDYHYLCKLTSEVPVPALFEYENSETINVEGNEINVFDDFKQYFGCVLFRSSDKEILALHYKEYPGFYLDSLHLEVNKKDNVWIPEGDILYNWSSCGNTQEDYELACEYSDSEPKSVNYDKATKFAIVCSGTNITSFTTSLTNDIYLGCSLVEKADKKVYDFHFIKGHQDESSSAKVLDIIVGVVSAVVALAIVALLVYIYIRSRKPKDSTEVPLIASEQQA